MKENTLNKCSSCGGLLIRISDSVCECEYCGLRKTITSNDNSEVAGLKKRANELFLKCDFDQAFELYSEAIALNDNDAELYWMCSMCTYGIEFVEEKGHKIPTCHRIVSKPITQNEYFQNAVFGAVDSVAESYQQIGLKINEIQKRIKIIASNEEPYDIFICYKQSDDETGLRTTESSKARDLYHRLTDLGYNVFFAEETLNKSHAGQEYEPIIYAALNSAKLMVLIADSVEHINAVWVKNEWSRFLQIIRKKPHLKLIQYLNRNSINIDSIPSELSKIEYLDSSVTSTGDLVNTITRLVSTSEKISGIDLFRRKQNVQLADEIYQIAKERKWDQLIQLCQRGLNIDKRFGDAYLGLLFGKFTVSSCDELSKLDVDFSNDDNYINAIKYLNAIRKEELVNALLSSKYNYAESLRNVSEMSSYLKAHELFGELGDYKDSKTEKYMCEIDIIGQIKSNSAFSFLAAVPKIYMQYFNANEYSFNEQEMNATLSSFFEEKYTCFFDHQHDEKTSYIYNFKTVSHGIENLSVISSFKNGISLLVKEINKRMNDALDRLFESDAFFDERDYYYFDDALLLSEKILDNKEVYKLKDNIYGVANTILQEISKNIWASDELVNLDRRLFEVLGNFKDSRRKFLQFDSYPVNKKRIEEIEEYNKKNSRETKEVKKNTVVFVLLCLSILACGIVELVVVIQQFSRNFDFVSYLFGVLGGIVLMPFTLGISYIVPWIIVVLGFVSIFLFFTFVNSDLSISLESICFGLLLLANLPGSMIVCLIFIFAHPKNEQDKLNETIYTYNSLVTKLEAELNEWSTITSKNSQTNFNNEKTGNDKSFPVRVLTNDGEIICPSCGLIQQSNRTCCWKCGMKFEKE